MPPNQIDIVEFCDRERTVVRSRRSAAGAVRKRTLVALAAVVPALALAPAAGAITLSGSGSSAAQPYMLKLFKGYSQAHKSIRFKYNPDGGNAGVVDVQQGRSQFAINTRPPLRSDSGT